MTLTGIAGNADATDVASLDDLSWIARDVDRATELTRLPAECIQAGHDPETQDLIALGRIAFRSPVLLGGLAARTGMSCQTCHRNGHGNSGFFVGGVSGDSGTVDVTGNVFSEGRDDGISNPVPIPSLVDIGEKSSFGTIVPKDDLRSFLASVIVEEFGGSDPPERILEALLSYLNALRSSSCPDAAFVVIDLASAAREVNASYEATRSALSRNDSETAEFTLLALKALLGRIHRRFDSEVEERQELVSLSRGLTPIRELLETQPDEAAMALLASQRESRRVIRALEERIGESYYDRGYLEAALGGH